MQSVEAWSMQTGQCVKTLKEHSSCKLPVIVNIIIYTIE